MQKHKVRENITRRRRDGRRPGLGAWTEEERGRERERERPEAIFATALPMAQKGAPRQIL